jgi:hypothetical protein
MHRLLTHSSSRPAREMRCLVHLYSLLPKRAAHPRPSTSCFVQSTGTSGVRKCWSQRKVWPDDQLFAQCRSCVFSNRNAPVSAEQGMETDLSLKELREQGQGQDFPPRTFFSLRSALLMGYILPWLFICDLKFSMGLPRRRRRPQNREYARSLL